MQETTSLLNPSRLWTRSEVLTRPCPVPREPGVYAWYFRCIPPGVPTSGCHTYQDLTLLYTGISPRHPPANGSPRPSKTCFIAFDTTSAATRRAPRSDSLLAAFLRKNLESSCAALGADSE